MKTIGLREAKATLSACIDSAQGERIVITRHGRPAALVIGVEGEPLEEVLLAADPEFWTLIEQRRRQSSTVSESEARRILGVERRPGSRAERSIPGSATRGLERDSKVGRRRRQKSSKRVN